jgi:ubiquinone/menaquinone biosynthesis C-methylase UbiE
VSRDCPPERTGGFNPGKDENTAGLTQRELYMNSMVRIFDSHAGDYDRWFDEHNDVYQAQLRMLRAALPDSGRGLEVGVGSGRFAVPFGIRYGIDPSPALLRIAKGRGVEVVIGEGEHLPYCEHSFDVVLMMTVICFLEDPSWVFRDVCRVLVPGGTLVVGFIEKDGEIAMQYRQEKTKGRFLQFARFRTVDEVSRYFYKAGFIHVSVTRRSRGFCVMKGQKQ